MSNWSLSCRLGVGFIAHHWNLARLLFSPSLRLYFFRSFWHKNAHAPRRAFWTGKGASCLPWERIRREKGTQNSKVNLFEQLETFTSKFFTWLWYSHLLYLRWNKPQVYQVYSKYRLTEVLNKGSVFQRNIFIYGFLGLDDRGGKIGWQDSS